MYGFNWVVLYEIPSEITNCLSNFDVPAVFQEWDKWMETAKLTESTDPNAIIIVNYPE